MKDAIKHIIDCTLAFAISFFSILAATGNISFHDALIALIPSVLVGLIKFRDYWNIRLNPQCQTHTILF
jgi:hypothetical protein